MRLKYYIKIWWLLTKNSFIVVMGQRVALTIFLLGKILRFIFFVSFLFYVVLGAKGILGYSSNQIIFFFLVFTLVDTVSQFFFREVYRFRPKVVSGDFDLSLVKPVNPLFISLLGGADIIDLITIPPLIITVFYVGSLFDPNIIQVFIFLILLLNALFVAAAFHIAVLAVGIITLEIDHTVMIYRDLTSFGRFPVDIYKQPLQGILTYVIPIGIMFSLPAKSLVGMVSLQGIILSIVFGFSAIFLSLKFWDFALTKYTSASS